MTDTITTGSDNVSGRAAATLEHLDPNTLVLETNVRDNVDIDAQFVANIKEHGVLIPISAVRAPGGKVVVRMGQRRTLAARKAGLTSVPVYVRPVADGDDTAYLVARVTEQIVENDHRRELGDAQRARGIQQLLDAGVSTTKVAQKLSVKKDTVKAAQAVGKSEIATAALATGQLTLAEAATLTEFEDTPAALTRLTNAAGTPQFDHVVAQLRQEQASRQAQAEAESHWRNEGFTVLDDRPELWDVRCVELIYLHTPNGARAEEDAVADPTQWAVLVEEHDAVLDADTGDMVDESCVDWTTEHDPDASPGAGMRHANTVIDGVAHLPTFYCLDYSAAGLTVDAWFLRNAGRIGDPGGDAESVDLDGEGSQDATAAGSAALAKAQAEHAETERRERKKVITLNRLGDAARQVRRDFVTKLLTRKTPPKGAAIFIADCLIREPALINDYHAATITAELLGVTEGDELRQLVTGLPPTGDGRAQIITLAVVLGALEARTPKDAWRSGRTNGWRYGVGPAEYITFLEANGYQLAGVERVIVGTRTSDDLYEQSGVASAAAADNDDPNPTGTTMENHPQAEPE